MASTSFRIKNKRKRLLVFLSVAIFALLLLITFITLGLKTTRQSVIMIGGQEIKAGIAETPWQRYRGLSGVEELCPDCGLLFLLPRPEQTRFVMRNMEFPLDIVFISSGRVVAIAPSAAPEGARPQTNYDSPGAVEMVLELNAGFCARNGIQVGEEIEIYE